MRLVWFACLVVGLYLLGSFAYGMLAGFREQQRLNQVWSAEIPARPPAAAPAAPSLGSNPRPVDPALKQPMNGVDFAIRIPKLNYFAAVKEGVSSGVLYASPGHYPTTVWPGDPGMVGVAAHNVYWINFPQLTKGDEIYIDTRYGTYRYRVTGSEIVNPDNRSVLVPNAGGFHLTLTTCWPLWAGAFATQRYVIFTDQVWPIPLRPGYT
ncbi:MAG TPA: class D sortase [Candidatus Acidoferrum sp.]|jgi:LPXTG-site transpeptidase (sortase) family protein|nr:class D sortase [Candidatus Acidoferrum sp.]